MECRNLQPYFDQQFEVKLNSEKNESKTRNLRITHTKARSYVCIEYVSHHTVAIIRFILNFSQVIRYYYKYWVLL